MSARPYVGLAAALAAAAAVTLSLYPTSAADPSTTPVTGLRENTPRYHAFVGARIVAAPGRAIEKGTLVIRDGVITAVGPEVTVPRGAVVWDVTGRTLYAGFIDADAEQAVTSSANIAGAWNQYVTPQLRVDEHYQLAADVNKKLRSQGLTLRVVGPAGGIVKGTGTIVTLGDDSANTAIVRPQSALYLKLSPPRGGRGFPNSPMGAMALVRQTLLDAQWYTRAWDAYRAAPGLPKPETNEALAALNDLLSRKLPIVCEAADVLYFLRADALAREFDLPLIVRGAGDEYQRLEAVKAAGRAVIVPIDFPKPPSVGDAEAAMTVSLERLMHWDSAPENPARLAGAGVKIAFTSRGLSDVAMFAAGVRKAVDRGLEADQALRALTTTPAEMFGIADRFGTLDVGKSATFSIVEGDWFTDAKAKVHDVWIGGVRHNVQPQVFADVRGRWLFELLDAGDAKKFSEPVAVVFEGEPDKLTGKLTRGKKETPLKNIGIDGAQLSASFKGDAVDLPGELQISATILTQRHDERADPQGTMLDGYLFHNDGTRTPWRAKRLSIDVKAVESKPNEPADEKNRDGEAKQPDKSTDDKPETKPDPKTPEPKQTAPVTAAGEKPKDTTERNPEGGKPSAAKPAAESKPSSEPNVAKPDASSSEKKPAAKESTTKKPEDKPKRALYPVNYPLGDFGVAAAPAQPAVTAFVGATIWTCGPAGVLEDAVVVVEHGKIKAVGRNVAVPPGAVVVQAKGMHLSPGIIDCHSHIATDGGVNESSQSITSEVRIADFIDPHDINIYRQLAGGVTAANILHGSANTIGGQNQVIKFRWGALPEEMKFAGAPAGIKFALGENVKQSNWGSDATGRYPQSRMGVEQLLRDAFRSAVDYRQRMRDYRRNKRGLPPRVDLELEALVEVLEGRRLIHCHSYRQDEILAFLRVCEEFHVRVATLQHILEGYKVADVMARHGVGGSSFADWWAYKFEVYDAIPYNGALMHDAGVVVSFNSDDAELARRLNLEAAKAVKYGGVKPEEALKFVTLNPAKQLGIDRYVGSIEPGKDADLALWSGSPLSTFSRCEQTWIDGRKYFDRAEDLKRREQNDSRRAALVQRVLGSGEPQATTPTKSSGWAREDIFCGCRSPHVQFGQPYRSEVIDDR